MKSAYTLKNVGGIITIMVLSILVAQNIEAAEFKLGKVDFDVHGFLSQGYLKTNHNNFLADTEDGSFEFREYGLNVSSDLTDQLHVGAQLFGRDLGPYGNDKPVLDWAFADLRLQDWLGIRAGRMKMVLGLYNETRDIDIVRTGIFLPESTYNDTWRESFTALNGVGLYGTLSLKSLGSLSYQAQWGKINVETDGGISRYLTEFFPMDIQKVDTSDVYAVAVEWVPAPPLDGLRLRWTLNIAEMEDEGTTTSHLFWQRLMIPPNMPLLYHADLKVHTISAEYRWGNLVLAAETFVPAGYDNRLEIPGVAVLVDDSPDKEGRYVSAAYRFTEWLELGLSYCEYYNNTHDKDGNTLETNLGYPKHKAWLKDTTLTARFDIKDHWVVKIEGHFMNGTDLVLVKDNPEGLDEDWFLFGCKVTYSF